MCVCVCVRARARVHVQVGADSLRVWLEVLRAVPGAVLALLDIPGGPSGAGKSRDPLLGARLRRLGPVDIPDAQCTIAWPGIGRAEHARQSGRPGP